MPPPSLTNARSVYTTDSAVDLRLFYFQDILQTAEKLNAIRSRLSETRIDTTSQLPITISLPTPTPITKKLLQVGIDAEKIDRISSLYNQKAQELREWTGSIIRQSSMDLAKTPNISVSHTINLQKHLHKYHTDAYLRLLDQWADEALRIACQNQRPSVGPQSSPSVPQRKAPFNHVSLPCIFSLSR